MNTCGTCLFRQPVPNDLKVGECYGMPPTPIVAPTPQGPQVAMVIPRVEVTRAACSLFKLKLAINS